MDDQRLLDHYLAMASEPWNLSPEAAYLDYLLRRWVKDAWPGGAVRAVNIGSVSASGMTCWGVWRRQMDRW